MALSRFEVRRDAVLNEANAIGTTALRARLLPGPHGSEALKSLREYVQIRLDVTQGTAPETRLKAAIARSNEIQETLWRNAMALAAKDTGLVPTGLFIQSLNEMIDSQETAGGVAEPGAEHRLPGAHGVAVVAFMFAGYANGLEARRCGCRST
jgi:hypothetical protein